MSCGIYKIQNLINNKVYIGQSVSIEKRFNKHKNAPFNNRDHCYNYPLYRAIRKYGLENFSFEIIEQTDTELLNEREIYWINYYNSNNNDFGYNQTSGGDAAATSNKLSYDDVEKIIYLLLQTNLSQEQISKQFNVSQMAISDINTGSFWHKDYLKYPLRKYSIKKKEYYCIDCGKKISKNALRCTDCYFIHNRKTNRPDKEELKQLIRNESFTQIGKKYGVSDNAIRRWCDSYKLPRKKTEIRKYSDEDWNKI